VGPRPRSCRKGASEGEAGIPSLEAEGPRNKRKRVMMKLLHSGTISVMAPGPGQRRPWTDERVPESREMR
jgi:hypothetical protein